MVANGAGGIRDQDVAHVELLFQTLLEKKGSIEEQPFKSPAPPVEHVHIAAQAAALHAAPKENTSRILIPPAR